RHTRSTRDWSSDVCSSDLGGRGWFSCWVVALSGEVDDGRGVEFGRGRRPRPGWGSAVRGGGRVDGKGRGREEPAQVGQLLRFPRGLCRAAGEGVETARRAADATRWDGRDERAARFGTGSLEGAWP